LERGYDAEDTTAVCAGVPAADGRARTGWADGTGASRELEPCYETMRPWARQADRNGGGDTSGLTPAEREELRRVKREPALREALVRGHKNHGVTSGDHALKTNPAWFKTRTRISLILEGISQALTLSTNFSPGAKVVRS